MNAKCCAKKSFRGETPNSWARESTFSWTPYSKYLRFSTLCCKDRGIRKSEFVENFFLSLKNI